ncbi:hypothetical protein T4D_6886 [Trichinella pseudospiralis]|uniref:Uncharacterized protein n=1 Tax=Trichinella pseudospiralis TaxID=6337 RepID=A0A0V1G4Q3_TRIPS|nr:hypothetical protein T4D_6886 [Trichinella pseudospiralis]
MNSPNEDDKINEDSELQMSTHDLLLAKAEFENFLVNMKALQDCLEELMPKTGTVSPMETFARCISNFTIDKDPQKPMIRAFLDFQECLEDISYTQQALYRRLCSQISPQIKQVTVDSAAQKLKMKPPQRTYSNMKSEMNRLLIKFLHNHKNLEMDQIQNLKNIAILLVEFYSGAVTRLIDFLNQNNEI